MSYRSLQATPGTSHASREPGPSSTHDFCLFPVEQQPSFLACIPCQFAVTHDHFPNAQSHRISRVPRTILHAHLNTSVCNQTLPSHLLLFTPKGSPLQAPNWVQTAGLFANPAQARPAQPNPTPRPRDLRLRSTAQCSCPHHKQEQSLRKPRLANEACFCIAGRLLKQSLHRSAAPPLQASRASRWENYP